MFSFNTFVLALHLIATLAETTGQENSKGCCFQIFMEEDQEGEMCGKT